jgi:hypothetical protein
MPLTGAQLSTALADRSLDPLRTQAAGAAGSTNGATVTMTVKFVQGVAADEVTIFNALVTAYGAGKVQSDRDQIRPGVLDLTIYP